MRKFSKQRTILATLLILSFTTLLIFQACRRSMDVTRAEKITFTVSDAKEWWYGKFVKSANYTSIDKTSPFAAPEGVSEKKYPRWKRAIAYTKGDIQVVEMPVVYEATRVSLAGLNDIAGTPEAARIAKATLHKLLIFKKA